MTSFFRELAGGVALMIAATVLGIGVNAVRPDGVALIQKGAVVSTAQHGDVDTAVIIDARSTEEYEAGHIPGSINIPHDRIPEFQDVLNREVSNDAHVICYCRSPSCDFSDLLATELKIIGWQDVSVFSGGWEEWTKAGFPVEKGPRP
jgi:3-mercaptopyruvate sulfurtransferase SseA